MRARLASGRRRGNPPLLAVLMLGSLALALLAACGEQSVSPPNDLLAPGALTVGSGATYPPQEYLDPTTHQPVGFNIDLITVIAQRMGLKAHIVSAPGVW